MTVLLPPNVIAKLLFDVISITIDVLSVTVVIPPLAEPNTLSFVDCVDVPILTLPVGKFRLPANETPEVLARALLALLKAALAVLYPEFAVLYEMLVVTKHALACLNANEGSPEESHGRSAGRPGYDFHYEFDRRIGLRDSEQLRPRLHASEAPPGALARAGR